MAPDVDPNDQAISTGPRIGNGGVRQVDDDDDDDDFARITISHNYLPSPSKG